MLYSRDGCHLCEDMLSALQQYSQELDYTIVVYDVDEDERLFEQFNALVPVVYLQGEELMRYFFEPATLEKRLADNNKTTEES